MRLGCFAGWAVGRGDGCELELEFNYWGRWLLLQETRKNRCLVSIKSGQAAFDGCLRCMATLMAGIVIEEKETVINDGQTVC